MLTNRSMPDCTVIPVLPYPDVDATVVWLARAFGFSERLRIGDHRAQLTLGEGCVIVAATPDAPAAGLSVMVRVDDADRHCEQARQAGAQILSPPTDYPYGERQYTAADFAGHLWTVSQTLADVDPAVWGGKLRE